MRNSILSISYSLTCPHTAACQPKPTGDCWTPSSSLHPPLQVHFSHKKPTAPKPRLHLLVVLACLWTAQELGSSLLAAHIPQGKAELDPHGEQDMSLFSSEDKTRNKTDTDVYENRQRQGIGGGGDEDQIPGDPTAPIMCSKFQGTGTALRLQPCCQRVPVPRDPELPGNTAGGDIAIQFKPAELAPDQWTTACWRSPAKGPVKPRLGAWHRSCIPQQVHLSMGGKHPMLPVRTGHASTTLCQATELGGDKPILLHKAQCSLLAPRSLGGRML